MKFIGGDVPFFRAVIVSLLVSLPLQAVNPQSSRERESPDKIEFTKVVKELINAQQLELKKLRSRHQYNETGYKIVTAGLFVAPFTILYYAEFLSPGMIELLKYYISPLTLGAYYFTITKNYQKTINLCHEIEADMILLSEFLPQLSKIIKYFYQEQKKRPDESEKKIFSLLENLETEHRAVYKFVVDTLRMGAKKFSYNPDMMQQTMGGSLQIRLLIILSILSLIESHAGTLDFMLDSQPSLSVAAFDVFNVKFHSYKLLLSHCANELNSNLNMLRDITTTKDTKFEPGDSLMSTMVHWLVTQNLSSSKKGNF